MSRTKTLVGASLAALAAVAGLSLAPPHNPAQAAVEPAGRTVRLQSAGALTFGPAGILFVGDSVGGSVVAIDTKDAKAGAPASINIDGVDAKIAALVGVGPDQIMINDMKVNPVSHNVYLSASRGRGPDAMPLIVKVDGAGKLTVLALDKVSDTGISLSDAPASDPSQKRDPRTQTITDMAYLNGSLMVAGLSNEEWSSALRSVPYPFKPANKATTLQIWHSSHGRFETEAPVRTFVPYTIGGQRYVLAAYTCTPLVKIPLSDLKPGAKVKGVEIADLGAGNQPLDMVPYSKDGHDYILIANTSRGVMKLSADNLEKYREIASPEKTGVAGVPYETIASLKDVTQLAGLDNAKVLVMSGKPGSVNLSTIALP